MKKLLNLLKVGKELELWILGLLPNLQNKRFSSKKKLTFGLSVALSMTMTAKRTFPKFSSIKSRRSSCSHCYYTQFKIIEAQHK